MAVEVAEKKEPMKERTPLGDWTELLGRTFDFGLLADVRCGGRSRVLASVKNAAGIRTILEHLGLTTECAKLALVRGPPQVA